MAHLVHRGAIAKLVALSIFIPSASWSQTPRTAADMYERVRAGDAAALVALQGAAEAGNVDSQFQLGRALSNGGPNVPRDDAAAAQWTEKAAHQGHAVAQGVLGDFYSHGRGVPKDDEKAFFWRAKSAEGGSAVAQYNLGVLLSRGIGTNKDERQAVSWFRKAAEQDYEPAMTPLAKMYAYGSGIPKDPAEALRWLRTPIASGRTAALPIYRDVCSENANLCGTLRAASHSARCDQKYQNVGEDFSALTLATILELARGGDVAAQNELGRRYGLGLGVPRDSAASFSWYEKAANSGHCTAQTNLAYMYLNGEGIENDRKLAESWSLKAAERGHAPGQYALGYMYITSVPKDGPAAEKWFLMAANQGHVPAWRSLIKMYLEGEGIPRDLEKADL